MLEGYRILVKFAKKSGCALGVDSQRYCDQLLHTAHFPHFFFPMDITQSRYLLSLVDSNLYDFVNTCHQANWLKVRRLSRFALLGTTVINIEFIFIYLFYHW